MDELQEAKLRALGVSFGDEPGPPPSISPGITTHSRRASVAHYPSSLPFSTPIPTPSAASNQAGAGFPFGQFSVSPAAQSPGIPGVPSPFGAGRFAHNPRASISVSSPHGLAWSPQMLLQHGVARGGSPALANVGGLDPPSSPFSPGGLHGAIHQRHMSLQYPMLPFQHSARASPRLQELQEEEEEEPSSESLSKTPELSQMARPNSSDSLQKEIDEAEYHLEEQMRSQLDNDQDYSPHNDRIHGEGVFSTENHISPGHAQDSSIQFAPVAPRFVNNSEGTVLHHPRPHSRGHSLSTKYFTEDDAVPSGVFQPNALADSDNRIAEESEIETNPSNLGTPVQPAQALEFGKAASHGRGVSTTSNPWSNNGSSRAASNFGGSKPPSHGSKPSFSKLNVAAPEFKFNPSSTFQPGAPAFSFGTNSLPQQPTVFQGSVAPVPVVASQFSFPPVAAPPAASSINVNAPVFSPKQSDFSFPSFGPKFRPDAPAFIPPTSVAGSINSPVSGAESLSRSVGSIFGSIDLSSSDIIKPTKKSKAVPILRPQSRDARSPRPEFQEDDNGRVEQDDSRHKRFRGSSKDADEVPRFAPRYEEEEEATPVPESKPENVQPMVEAEDQLDKAEADVPIEEKSFGDDFTQADTTFSSAMVSETTGTDTKATATPSETSPDPGAMTWAPFEFKNTSEVQSFNEARPFGEDTFQKGHKKSLSATANAFTPGASLWGSLSRGTSDDSAAEEEGFAETADNTVEVLRSSVENGADEPAKDILEVSTNKPIVPLQETQQAEVQSAKPPTRKGLAASRWSAAPSPPPMASSPELGVPPVATSFTAEQETEDNSPINTPVKTDNETRTLSLAGDSPMHDRPAEPASTEQFAAEEASMADIDAIMAHLNANPDMGVHKVAEAPQWHQPSPTRHLAIGQITESSPVRLPSQHLFRSDAPSPSPQRYQALPTELEHNLAHPDMEDPFLDPPRVDGPPASDWDGVFSGDEQTKLEGRVNFFDGHVNEVVGDLLANRLAPLEETLDDIKNALSTLSHQKPASRRDRRSTSAEAQESDADDEDEELPLWAPRSMSPKKDRKMEQIRAAVLDALATQQHIAPPQATPPADSIVASDSVNAAVVKALEEMKEQFNQSLHLDLRGDDLQNLIRDAVQERMPPTHHQDQLEAAEDKNKALQARIDELEAKVRSGVDQVEREIDARRAAEERSADLSRRLEFAETRIEIEIMNKSAFDQRLTDLEDKLHQQEVKTDEQLQGRRTAEDRLSEVQRLLRIASEEENRLREVVEEKDQRIKSLEAAHGKSAMRLTLLENAQANSQQSQSELQNRLNITEAELKDARQDVRHWKDEAERLMDVSARKESDLEHALGENRAMRKLMDTLGTQLQENEKMRDSWRTRFMALQDDMALAAREIEEDNSQRIKKEQTLLARQEVLEARLQAEAKTRERIEAELERLEGQERDAIRAISENKRLEVQLGELRTENHKLQQNVHRFQAEFEEARESGAREIKRTRESMQAELEQANHQVNVVREELEDQVNNLRAQLDRVKLDADTAQARHEMLLEEAQNSTEVEVQKLMVKQQTERQELITKYQNEMEDMQARYERQLTTTSEDAQRTEQNLLERLSISTSKSEYLQDKVAHLDEKLEIAKEAARAAAQAATGVVKSSVTSPDLVAAPMIKPATQRMELPEKISPQALRESIMVLQEQLQERELRLEELEQELAKVDPEADTKIAKRDDEIIWLRELLAVRHSDLHDIITALQRDDYDRNAVKDAAIRLKANLQMEEQERERAMNGGSAINLPNIAATIRDAATPRVAQAVGPLAAAWGNWRKTRDTGSFGSLSGVLSSPSQARATASRATPSKPSPSPQSSFLNGLLTPPASGVRPSPPSSAAVPAQPTAFSSTGRRFPASQQPASSRARGASTTSVASEQAEKQPLGQTPPRRNLPAGSGPVTPPMMRTSAYDSDAQAEEFDDAGFFEDD